MNVTLKSTRELLPKILMYREKELEKHLPREPSIYYITDLVRCSLKRDFEIAHPKLMYARIMSGRTFLGETVHKGLELILKEIFGNTITVENESLEKEREIEVNSMKFIVKGKIDGILENNIGIEIKETVSHATLPFPHHVEQCALYNWLYNLQKTLLLYITPDGIYEFTIEDKANDADVVMRIKEKKSPRYTWECEACDFKQICSIAKLSEHENKPKNT